MLAVPRRWFAVGRGCGSAQPAMIDMCRHAPEQDIPCHHRVTHCCNGLFTLLSSFLGIDSPLQCTVVIKRQLDSVLIIGLRVDPEQTGHGIGTLLMVGTVIRAACRLWLSCMLLYQG